MPVHIDEIKQLSQQAITDANQSWSIENLTKHVRALWHHVERLEKSKPGNQNEIVLRAGDASITLKKDGTIVIKGNNITIESSGKTTVKAGGDLVMKGSKILQN